MLGRIGTIKKIDSDSDAIIKVDGDMWMVNAAILTLHEEAKENTGEDSDGANDDGDDDNPLASILKQHALQKRKY